MRAGDTAVHSRSKTEFDSNVFINCPFDEDYYPLLRPLLFTIIYLGFTPRIALERSDSGENRVDKISELLAHSRFDDKDLNMMPVPEYMDFMRDWIASRPESS